MLYWPEFKFEFRLDMPRLLPYLAAIEADRESALNRVLPPYWREKPSTEVAGPAANDLPEGHRAIKEPLELRKLKLLSRNAGVVQAWVRGRFAPGRAPLSMEDLLTMHRMVAEETGIYYNHPGVLRSSSVWVGRREAGGMHVGAPVHRLPLLMDFYVRFINGKQTLSLPPMIHALVAHFFFTTIHPFEDGNGRMCRLISAAILFQRGYNGHGLYALGWHFYQNDTKYHTLLQLCWKEPLPFDLTQFVAFGLEGMVIELRSIRAFVKLKLSRNVERQLLTPALRKKVEGRCGRLREFRSDRDVEPTIG
jgi:Fic family protein